MGEKELQKEFTERVGIGRGRDRIYVSEESEIGGGNYWSSLQEGAAEDQVGNTSYADRQLSDTARYDAYPEIIQSDIRVFHWAEECDDCGAEVPIGDYRKLFDNPSHCVFKEEGIHVLRSKNEIRDYSESVARRIKEGFRKRDFIRSIVTWRSVDELARINRILDTYKPGTGTGVIIWGKHWEGADCGHTHIYHDCNKNHGQCRCSFIADLKGHLGTTVRHHEITRATGDITEWDILRILLYLSEGARSIQGIRVHNTRAAVPTRASLLQATGSPRNSTSGPLAAYRSPYELSFREQQYATPSTSSGIQDSARRSRSIGWTSVRGKKEIVSSHDFDALTQFVEQHFVVPLDAIVRTEAYNASRFRDRRAGDSLLGKVSDHVITKLLPYTLGDFEVFWDNQIPPLYWHSREYRSQGLICYDLATSVAKAEKFLLYQYQGDVEGMTAFLDFSARWLNRQSGKMNTVEVIAEPSAGKNWFWDPISIFCTSVGMIGNLSKGNNFPWDGCHNKRLLVFNEPIFENRFYEELKIVMGGSPFAATAKYRSNMEILRTPVLVLCNVTRFPNRPEWRERIFRVRWSVPPDSSDMNMRLDPRFFVHLLKKPSNPPLLACSRKPLAEHTTYQPNRSI